MVKDERCVCVVFLMKKSNSAWKEKTFMPNYFFLAKFPKYTPRNIDF